MLIPYNAEMHKIICIKTMYVSKNVQECYIIAVGTWLKPRCQVRVSNIADSSMDFMKDP